jgi:hypothetical protein
MSRLARQMPRYPTEAEIGRAVLGDRAKEWPALAIILERRGMPGIDPLMGGRPWRKVEKFFDTLEDLDAEGAPGVPSPRSRVRIMDFAPDGQDNANGAQTKAFHRRRPGSRDQRARA